MRWMTAKADHIGGRAEQQDRCGIFSSADGQRHLLLVADGMGGHEGGALAAQAVLDTAASFWEHTDNGAAIDSVPDFLGKLLNSAHARINQIGEERALSPHSTAVLLYINDAYACWTHIGDSRLYHFRNGDCLHRTKDHSLVQLLVDMGRLQEAEMGQHKDQNYLLRGLGGDEALDLEFADTRLQTGDCFVLCSDGLWEQFSPSAILAALPQQEGPQAAMRLVEAAVERGGPHGDNVSLVCAQRLP